MELKKIFPQELPTNKLSKVLLLNKINKYCKNFIKNVRKFVDINKLLEEKEMFMNHPDLVAKDEDIIAVKYNLKAPKAQSFKDAMKAAYINEIGHSIELVNAYISENQISIDKIEEYKKVEEIYSEINRSVMETSIAKTCFYDYLAIRLETEKEKRYYLKLQNNG